LITDPIADNSPGFQEGIADLLVDAVAREEPSQIRRLEWDELVIQVLEHPLGVQVVKEEPGVIAVLMEGDWQDLGGVEADWVVE
jgi:hypothetical protein